MLCCRTLVPYTFVVMYMCSKMINIFAIRLDLSTSNFVSFFTQLLRTSIRPVFRRGFSSVNAAGAHEAANGGFWFGMSDEQKEIVNLAKKFTKEEIIPVAAEYDRTGEYPWPIVKKAWELGLLNNHIPEAVGGMDMSVVTSCLVAEEFAYGLSYNSELVSRICH